MKGKLKKDGSLDNNVYVVHRWCFICLSIMVVPIIVYFYPWFYWNQLVNVSKLQNSWKKNESMTIVEYETKTAEIIEKNVHTKFLMWLSICLLVALGCICLSMFYTTLSFFSEKEESENKTYKTFFQTCNVKVLLTFVIIAIWLLAIFKYHEKVVGLGSMLGVVFFPILIPIVIVVVIFRLIDKIKEEFRKEPKNKTPNGKKKKTKSSDSTEIESPKTVKKEKK